MTHSSSDLNSNRPNRVVQQPEVFQTPWQNKLGKRERLCLTRNKIDGTVSAQILTQSIFKRFTYFFEKRLSSKSAPLPKEQKYSILEEKNFTNISATRFEEETKHLEKLLKNHASIKSLLSQVEADFKAPQTAPRNADKSKQDLNSPSYERSSDPTLEETEADFDLGMEDPEESTLTPKEIQERHGKIEDLRSELETLLEKINEQELSPKIQSFEKLYSSIKRIKDTALATFSDLGKLERDANNPTISSAKLNEAVQEIKSSHLKWNQDIASIRQTLLEESGLQNEIESFDQHIQFFSQPTINKWKELFNQWKETPTSKLSSQAEVQQRKNSINKIMATVCGLCKQELTTQIRAATDSLEQEEKAYWPGPAEEDKRKAAIEFRELLLSTRINAWDLLTETKSELGNDLSKIAALKDQVLAEQANDEFIISILNTPIPQEGYASRLFSLVKSPFNRISNPFKSILPTYFNPPKKSESLAEKQLFDETALFYFHQTLTSLQDATQEIFQLIESSNPAEAILLQRNDLLGRSSLKKSELDKFIKDLQLNVMDLASSEAHEENSEELKAALQKLKALHNALSDILGSQNDHNEIFTDNVKQAHAPAFDESTHHSILRMAQTTLEQIFKPHTKDIDLLALGADWEAARDSSSSSLETLAKLKQLADIHKEYDDIATWTTEAVKTFTGIEKAAAEKALIGLKTAIGSLHLGTESDSINETMIAAYKIKLLQANSSLDDLFKVERQKAAIRASISSEIDMFAAEMQEMGSQVEDIEAFYSIKLNAAKDSLNKAVKDIAAWKEIGSLPTSYMGYAPQSTLGSILYYASAFLPSSRPSVKNLNVEELKLYLESLKAEIEIQRKALSYTHISSAHKSLKEFQEEVITLETHIKFLTSGVKTTRNEPLIPRNLSANDLPKLQFHNAAVTTNKLKAIQEEQKRAVNLTPDLKAIKQRLTSDVSSIKSALSHSKKSTNTALLVQIEKLEKNPEQQRLAKLAFIEMLTTKMSEHTDSMTSKAKAIEPLPKIYEEAVRLVEKTKRDMDKKLTEVSPALRSHATPWKAIKHAKAPMSSEPFATKPDITVAAISVKDLRTYASYVETAIQTGADHMALVLETHSKIKTAISLLDDKINEINKFTNALDSKNQLVSKAKMEKILVAVKESMKQFSASRPNQQAAGWFDYLSLLTTPPQNLPAKQVTLSLLSEYQKTVGEAISKLEAAREKLAASQDLTIPQQIALSPDAKTAEELRNRFHKKNLPLITSTRSKLQSYIKDGNLYTSYSRYVPATSSLYHDIEVSINKKLKELNEYEKGYKTPGWLFGSTNTTMAELTPAQMESYAKKLTDIQSAFVDDLNQKFHIEKLVTAQNEYETAKITEALQLTETLRKKSNFLEAYRFEKRLSQITKVEETTWMHKVRKASQLPDLITDLKSYTKKIHDLLEEFESKKDPLPVEEQIRQLLIFKAQEQNPTYLSYFQESSPKSQEIVKKIDQDIKKLQSKLHAFVEAEREEHKAKLEQAKTDIEELFSTFTLSIVPKKQVIRVIDDQLKKFSRLGTKFATTNNMVLPNTMKTVSEMTPQEILIAKAEKGTTDLIAQSNKKISEVFDFIPICESYTAYKDALKSAEQAALALEREGQMSHAAGLNDKIYKIEKEELEKRKKVPVTTKDELDKLTTFLDAQTASLRLVEQTAKNKPKLHSIEQVKLIVATSPYRGKLEEFVRKDIETSLETQQDKIEQYSADLDKLVKKLNFPRNWQTAIDAELKVSKDNLEKSLSLTKTSLLGFKSSKSLAQLSIEDLVKVDQNQKEQISALHKIAEKYKLEPINDQLQRYESHLKIVQNLKAKWLGENHIDSIDKLESLTKEVTKQLEDFFKDQEKRTSSMAAKVELFHTTFTTIIKEFNRQTAIIQKDKPASIGALLQTTDITKSRYLELRLALRHEIERKISDQQKALKEYLTKLSSIEKQINTICGNSAQIPDDWKSLFKSKITYKQDQITELAKGLPFISKDGSGWINFDDLDAKGLLEYETLVDRITEKDEQWKTTPVSQLGNLEARMRFKDIEKYLDLLKKAIKPFETTIDRTTNLSKKQFLTAILEANKLLLFASLNNLKTFQDIQPLIHTIRQVKANLLRAQEQKDMTIATMTRDPWSVLHFHEVSKKAGDPEGNPANDILDRGYSVSYSRADDPDNTSDTSHTEHKLSEIIETNIANLEKIKDDFEAFVGDLTKKKTDPAVIKKAGLVLTKEFPELLKNLEDLKLGLPTTDRHGVNVTLKLADLKTFDHLLQYRTLVYNTVSKTTDFFAEIMDEKDFYWSAQAINAQKAKEAPLLAIGGEGEFDIDEEPAAAAHTPPPGSAAHTPPSGSATHVPATGSSTHVPPSGSATHVPATGLPVTVTPPKRDAFVFPTIQDPSTIASGSKPTSVPSETALTFIADFQSAIDLLQKNSTRDIRSLTLSELKTLKSGPAFKIAKERFDALWDKGSHLEKLLKVAVKQKRDLAQNLTRSLPVQEEEIYRANLIKVFDSLVNSSNVNASSLTLSQTIEHLKNLSNAQHIQEMLVKIAAPVHQVTDLHKQASALLASGHLSSYLSPAILTNWSNKLNQLTQPSTAEELTSAEEELQELLKESIDACKQAELLEKQKAPILSTLETARRKIEAELRFLPGLSGKLFSVIDQLKITYNDEGHFSNIQQVSDLTIEELPDYKVYVEKIVKAKINDRIPTKLNEEPTKTAIDSYQKQVEEIQKTIRQLRNEKKHDLAHNLTQALTQAQDKLETLALTWTNANLPAAIDETKALLGEALIKELEASRTSTTDPSTQLPNIPEHDAEFKEIKTSILALIHASYDTITGKIIDMASFDQGFAYSEKQADSSFTKKEVKADRNLRKAWEGEINSIQALIKPYKDGTDHKVRRGFNPTKISVALDQLSKSELIQYDAQAKAAFKAAEEKIKVLKTISTNLTQLDIQTVEVAADQVITDLKKVKNPYPYFHIDMFEKTLTSLLIANGSLRKIMISPDSQLEDLLEAAKNFQEKLSEYHKVSSTIKTATDDYRSSIGLYAQLKAEAANPGTLKPESRTAILNAIKKQAETNIAKAVLELDKYARTLEGLPEQLKAVFSDHIKAKKTELEALKKTDSDLAKLSPKELFSWFSQIEKDSGNAVSALETSFKLESRKTKFDSYVRMNKEIDELLPLLQLSKPDLAKDLLIDQKKSGLELEKSLKKLSESKITFDEFWNEFDQLYATLSIKLLAAKPKSPSASASGTGFRSSEDLFRHFFEQELKEHFSGGFEQFFGHGFGLVAKPNETDSYSILGLERTATTEEITKKYRKLALQYHPDKFQPEAHETPAQIEKRKQEYKAKFQEISGAFEVLTKPK